MWKRKANQIVPVSILWINFINMPASEAVEKPSKYLDRLQTLKLKNITSHSAFSITFCHITQNTKC